MQPRGIPFSTTAGISESDPLHILTFSLPCFCSPGDSGFLLLPIFHRSSKLADIVYTGSETKRSDFISRGFQANYVEMQVSRSSVFKMRGDYLSA